MVHIFYRKNKHSISKFLSYFTNDLLDQLKDDFKQVGLDDMYQKVSTLSGGMKRRYS